MIWTSEEGSIREPLGSVSILFVLLLAPRHPVLVMRFRFGCPRVAQG